jgi:RNA polymerase sigma-70 factor, ECF subfamily
MDGTMAQIDQFREELQAFAYRLLGSVEEAEDCVQNAYLAAVRNPQAPENARAWLYRVTHNLAVNQLRRRDHALRREAPPAQPRAGEADLDRALADLPEDQRTILLLRYTHGLSFEEIAEVVGRPTGTVKVYAGRGLTALRKALRRNP